MSPLYEGVKQPRLQVASRHSRRARLSFAIFLSVAFGALERWRPGPSQVRALGLTLAWLGVALLMRPLSRRLERRGWLLRGLVAGYGIDAAYVAAVVWALGGSQWVSGIGLITTLSMAGLYLPQAGMGWVVLACLGAQAVLIASPWLGPLAPPVGGPFPALVGGSLAATVDLAVLGVLSLLGWASFRYGRETSLRENELRQVNQRLRGLNEALSDQQFSLLVSQQDLLLANERLRLKNEEVLKSQDVIRTLAQALEARDHYTQGHS